MQHVVDLTHTLDEQAPSWTGSCGFLPAIKLDYDQRCRVQNIKLHAGIGTHIDAPAHFVPGALEVSDLSLSSLIVPLMVIDVQDKVKQDDDYHLQPDDILAFEQTYGTIRVRSLVVINTGWNKRWHEPERYRNPDEHDGQMHFPSVSLEAAELLLTRDIAGIGIDTLSPDCSQDDFPVHKLLLGAGRYIVENVAHLEMVEPTGFTACILPLKGKGLVEAPVRIIAFKQ